MTTKREIDNLAKAKVTSIVIIRDDRGEVESIRVESKGKFWDLKGELNKQATGVVISVVETSKPKPVKIPRKIIAKKTAELVVMADPGDAWVDQDNIISF